MRDFLHTQAISAACWWKLRKPPRRECRRTRLARSIAGGADSARPEAKKGLSGVREGAFAAYRVFGCEGSTTSDILLAAMEQAMDDKADVVNMSLGSAGPVCRLGARRRRRRSWCRVL